MKPDPAWIEEQALWRERGYLIRANPCKWSVHTLLILGSSVRPVVRVDSGRRYKRDHGNQHVRFEANRRDAIECAASHLAMRRMKEASE